MSRLLLLCLIFINSIFAMEAELGLSPQAQEMIDEGPTNKTLYLVVEQAAKLKFLSKVVWIREYDEEHKIDLRSFYNKWYQKKTLDEDFSQEKFKKKYHDDIEWAKGLQKLANQYEVRRSALWHTKTQTTSNSVKSAMIIGMALPKKCDKQACADQVMMLGSIEKTVDETQFGSLDTFQKKLQRIKDRIRKEEKKERKDFYVHLHQINCTWCGMDMTKCCTSGSDVCIDHRLSDHRHVPCCACGIPSTHTDMYGEDAHPYDCYCACFDCSWLFECLCCCNNEG